MINRLCKHRTPSRRATVPAKEFTGQARTFRKKQRMKHIRKIINRLSVLLKSTVIMPPSSNDRGKVLMIFSGKAIPSRRIRELFIFLDLAGYDIYVQVPVSKAFVTIVGSLQFHKNVKVTLTSFWINRYVFVFTDKKEYLYPKEIKFEKDIRMIFDYFPNLPLTGEEFRIPELMHPQLYVQYHAHKNLEHYRSGRKKTVKILAAGKLDDTYNNDITRKIYKKKTRVEVFSHILSTQKALLIDSEKEWRRICDGDNNSDIIIVSQGARINLGQWLYAISLADFVICTPGWCHPCTSVAIEALAVGTIPIISFSELFAPGLEHGTNCFIFDNFEELDSAVQSALTMDREEKARMSKEAVTYYRNNYDAEAFWRNIKKEKSPQLLLHLWPEETIEAIQEVVRTHIKNNKIKPNEQLLSMLT
jgi:hypothetical protein